MTTRTPYAPPADPLDAEPDTEFDSLPSDVELNFNDGARIDEFESEDDGDVWDDEEEDFEDDDFLVELDDNGAY